MRWLRFEQGDTPQMGRLEGDAIQPVAATDALQLIAGEGTEDAGAPVPLGAARVLAPLRPPKIIAVGLNYMDHCREQNVRPPREPLLFSKFPTAVIGPEQPIRWARGLTERVDFEVELAVVVGETMRLVPAERALEHVFGYTAANDVSARDLQFGDKQWTRGKGLDTFCPLGPVIVTADEIDDVQALPLTTRVNGKLYQDSTTAEMIFPVSELLAFISRALTLEPADVVLTGTPHGVGVFRDPQVFLQPGDVVEVEVADFGVLRNSIGLPIDPPDVA